MGRDLPEGHGGAAVSRDFEDLGRVSPYELLGVSPGAGTADVNRAYRRLVLTAHPDRGGDEASLKRLNLAREVLLDRSRRAEVDQRLRRQRGEGGEEVPNLGPESRVAPYEDRFGWTYGTGPMRRAAPQPEPEQRGMPREELFGWTCGTGPSPN